MKTASASGSRPATRSDARNKARARRPISQPDARVVDLAKVCLEQNSKNQFLQHPPVAKRDPPKVTTKSAAAAPAKTKGPGRPPKAAAAKKGQDEDEEENDDDDNDTVNTEE